MDKPSAVVARSEDGTVQINFTIPFQLIQKTKDVVVAQLTKDVEIAGFRKGKAPIEKIKEKIPENTIVERVLGQILPSALGNAINMHKIKIAIYPKFELLKSKDGEDWEIRAITCELPNIDLSDYKKIVEGAGRSSEQKQPTLAQKQEIVLKALLENIKLVIPSILIDEETNSRLSSLLERVEKLGLSFENYLSSIGKTPETLRAEYKKQAQDSIAIELILNKIADTQNIEISEKEIEDAARASATVNKDSEKADSEEQKRIIKSILRRRAVLDSLVSLV